MWENGRLKAVRGVCGHRHRSPEAVNQCWLAFQKRSASWLDPHTAPTCERVSGGKIETFDNDTGKWVEKVGVK